MGKRQIRSYIDSNTRDIQVKEALKNNGNSKVMLGSTIKMRNRSPGKGSQIGEEEEEKKREEVRDFADATFKSGFFWKSNLFLYDQNNELTQVNLSKTMPKNKGALGKMALKEQKSEMKRGRSF